MTREEREEAKAYFQSQLEWKKENQYPYISAQEEIIYKRVLEALEQQPKTGQWIENIDNDRKWDKVRFYCSECGHWQSYGKTKYCPNCGAKMESEVSNADSN